MTRAILLLLLVAGQAQAQTPAASTPKPACMASQAYLPGPEGCLGPGFQNPELKITKDAKGRIKVEPAWPAASTAAAAKPAASAASSAKP